MSKSNTDIECVVGDDAYDPNDSYDFENDDWDDDDSDAEDHHYRSPQATMSIDCQPINQQSESIGDFNENEFEVVKENYIKLRRLKLLVALGLPLSEDLGMTAESVDAQLAEATHEFNQACQAKQQHVYQGQREQEEEAKTTTNTQEVGAPPAQSNTDSQSKVKIKDYSRYTVAQFNKLTDPFELAECLKQMFRSHKVESRPQVATYQYFF